MDSILSNHDQNVNNERDQVVKDCLGNSVVMRTIFQHFPDSELLKLSLVNKTWNYEARSLLKNRGNLFAHVSCLDVAAEYVDDDDDNEQCQEHVQAFLAAIHQMNVVPFTGISIHIEHDQPSHERAAQNDANGIILDQLQLKKVSVYLSGEYEGCPGFLLAKKVFQDFSKVLEELSVDMEAADQKSIEDVIKDCTFPCLKVLKLHEYYIMPDIRTCNMKLLVSRAPTLQEIHTGEPIESVLKNLEGSSAVIVYTVIVLAPFHEIVETAIDVLRLEKLQLFYTGVQFNFERFSRIAPRLLETSCITTLRSLWIDAVLAVLLMRYGICLQNVKELEMRINHRQFEVLEPRILGTVKNLDFTRIFPNLEKVKVCGDYSPDLSADHLVQIIEQADAIVTDPKPDRAANVKELLLNHCSLSNVAVEFFARMFPSIKILKVDSTSEEEIPFGYIWKHWVDLEELVIVGRMIRNNGNLDSIFCGIFPAEVAELRQKDDEYLKSVHIVPVMPAITCLKNLRRLRLCRVGLSRDRFVNDGTFMFSKVTGSIVFDRYPSMAVTLNFRHEISVAMRHLDSIAFVTFY